jgi:hypothetical protein
MLQNGTLQSRLNYAAETRGNTAKMRLSELMHVAMAASLWILVARRRFYNRMWRTQNLL